MLHVAHGHAFADLPPATPGLEPGLGQPRRAIAAAPLTGAAYLLVSLAAVARLVGPEPAMMLAATAWTAAFVGFVIVYAPIFLGPRLDDQPG